MTTLRRTGSFPPPSGGARRPQVPETDNLESSALVVSSAPVVAEPDYRTIQPFRGDLRGPGVREQLAHLFDLARQAALSGRLLRRGTFLDLVL